MNLPSLTGEVSRVHFGTDKIFFPYYLFKMRFSLAEIDIGEG